jgi:flavin reductase (DIM6/NTAB) family NADH-FMN oxidoreductase RutF
MSSASIHCLRSRSLPPTLAAEADRETSAAAREIANCVCVVTAGAGETAAGAVARSVSLLSSDPATLLICLNRTSEAYPALARSGRIAVNVLGGDQREVAEHFARLPAGTAISGGSETCARLTLSETLEGLADCAAVFECEIEETIERGSNALVIARVDKAATGGGSGALVRWRGSYDPIGWSREEICRAVGLRPGADGTNGF